MTRRDQIMKQALRAAAAATGRATRYLQVTTTACAALLGASCDDTHAALAEEPRADATTAPTAEADAATAPAAEADAATAPAAEADVATAPATCGLTPAGHIDWRCCVKPSADPAMPPQWDLDRSGCGLCLTDLTDGTDWDAIMACCTSVNTQMGDACQAEPASERAACFDASYALMGAEPRCTPWGPPAPPQRTAARLAAFTAFGSHWVRALPSLQEPPTCRA